MPKKRIDDVFAGRAVGCDVLRVSGVCLNPWGPCGDATQRLRMSKARTHPTLSCLRRSLRSGDMSLRSGSG